MMGLLFFLEIAKTGELTLLKKILDISPGSAYFEPQDITFDRTGAYLFVAGDEYDSDDKWVRSLIHVYSKNQNFVAVDGSPFVTCNVPRSIAVGPDGDYLYVITSTSTASVHYHPIDAEGKLGDKKIFNNGYQATALAINGNFLYLAKLLSASVNVYSINADGSLTSTGSSVPLGASSEMLEFDPSGKYLYTNEFMNHVIRGFLKNPNNGSLTEIPGSPLDVGNRIRAIVIVGKK